MKIKTSKPTSPGRRFRMDIVRPKNAKKDPEKSLVSPQRSKAGRSKGRISIRHRGGGVKKQYRKIDFKRDKKNIEAVVKFIEYDPNRTANIALLFYVDGEKRYILAPEGLKVGDRVISGERVPQKIGNSTKLRNFPLGSVVHNVELTPGCGGQLVRSAGTAATLMSKDGAYVQLKMPSGERRMILGECFASLGQLSNPELKNIKLGKAGRSRLMGRRPEVRGVAMYPAAHPHGGGEARAGIGMSSPKTPWGKPTLGWKTRKRKNTTKYIVKDRRKK